MSFDRPPEETGEAPRRRFPWLVPLIVVGVGIAVAGWIMLNRHAHALDSVVATSGRLTLAEEKGGNLTVVNRQTEPLVFFRVVLEEVPLDAMMDLTCEWVAPGGKVTRTNRYQTRRIDKAIWPTHARCHFLKDFPTGTWTVRLLIPGKWLRKERLLIEKAFEVRNGGK